MKYGLDIKIDSLRVSIEKRLKDQGHTVVSMEGLEYYNNGDMLYKKVLLANQTKVDFYLKMDLEEGKENRIVIYGDRSTKSLKFYDEIYAQKDILDLVDLKYLEGFHYYLIKNIKGSSVILNLAIKKDYLNYDKVEEYITNGLLVLNE